MSGRRAYCRVAFLLFYFLLAAAVDEDDVRCLRGLKDALGDPDGRLSWNFANASVGFVCNFVGVTCWNPQENRVIALSLPSMSLTGSVPSALQFCRAATILDLSSNSLTGSIPSDLCDWLPFLVNLDLSGNSLSGPIPPELSNCRFLNSLRLSSNSLSGQIPASLSFLDRLKYLDLSRNRLSGEVPQSLAASFPSSSVFESNAGLCGRPVSSRCGSRSINRTGLIIVISAGVFGAAASLLIAYAIWRFRLSADSNRMKNGGGDGVQCWAKRLRASHNRLVPVQLFQKPIVKLKLSDLMAATGDFHPDHIVAAGSSRAGTSYKAVLRDGSALTVKRLHGCPLDQKQFRAEMGRLGQLRHPNLAPLLGFCIIDDDFLLIYKHMANGDLSTHLATSTSTLHWSARLRIAISAARGLAWLHHGFPTPLPHLYISSSTILLDEECEARITDFGMPRLIVSQPPDAPYGTSLFLKGNFGEPGYLPPEHAGNPVAAVKADVFAFGVVLLELATGRNPAEVSPAADGEEFKCILVDWINQLSVTNRMLDSLDNFLRGKGDDTEVLEFLRIALSCAAIRPEDRPSMHHVYQSLKNIGGGGHDFSEEQFDEFPLVYGKDDPESVRGGGGMRNYPSLL